MNIAADIGTTFSLGRYTVRVAMRPDNPAFATYLIFRGNNVLVGKSFSRPSLPDCEWLERWGDKYATVSQFRDISASKSASAEERRARGGDAERRRREAIAA